MPYDAFKHKRRSFRLQGYDYTSPGGYFITIDTHRSMHLFGEIIGGVMRLNDWGNIANDEWLKTATIRPEIELDEFQIMPDHIHGIIMINDVGATRRVAPTTPNTRLVVPTTPKTTLVARSIGAIMAQYKSIVTKRINKSRGTSGATVWQRDYYEHVIRDEHDLSRIREYIRNNPMQWEIDGDNGARKHRGARDIFPGNP